MIIVSGSEREKRSVCVCVCCGLAEWYTPSKADRNTACGCASVLPHTPTHTHTSAPEAPEPVHQSVPRRPPWDAGCWCFGLCCWVLPAARRVSLQGRRPSKLTYLPAGSPGTRALVWDAFRFDWMAIQLMRRLMSNSAAAFTRMHLHAPFCSSASDAAFNHISCFSVL